MLKNIENLDVNLINTIKILNGKMIETNSERI